MQGVLLDPNVVDMNFRRSVACFQMRKKGGEKTESRRGKRDSEDKKESEDRKESETGGRE